MSYDPFYTFSEGEELSAATFQDIRELSVHPPLGVDLLGGGQKEDVLIDSKSDENTVPFIITVTNPETQDESGAPIIDTSVIKIHVNGGTAHFLNDQPLEFEEENFNIRFDVENIIKIYAEAKLTLENKSYTNASSPRIKHVEQDAEDYGGVNFRIIKEGSETFVRQMIGTVEVQPMINFDPNSNRKFYRAVINQIIGGDFHFGPSDPDGVASDVHGNDTRSGVKEILGALDDNLYKYEIDVIKMQAVE